MDHTATMNLWISNDAPVYFAAMELINTTHSTGRRLDDAAWRVRTLADEVLFTRYPSRYRALCDDVDGKRVPVDQREVDGTRGEFVRSDMDLIDWAQIVRDLNEDITWEQA